MVDGRTFLLLVSLGFLAYALCPSCHWLKPRVKRLAGLALPPAVLLSWFTFQRELLFTDDMSEAFYRSMYGEAAWKLNSAILVAFGVGFSLRAVRTMALR